MFCRDSGPRDAPVPLLLHGLPASPHQYVHLVDRLSDGIRVIARVIWALATAMRQCRARQALLRNRQPPSLIAWGRNDPLFAEPGARAHLRDLPQAELQLFDTGQCALGEQVSEIDILIRAFVDQLNRR